MTTRTLTELIEEVRFNTNSTDDDRFTDARLIKFFNSAQRQIQKILYNSNLENSPFTKEAISTLIPGTYGYDLPVDIFAISAVSDITPVTISGSRGKSLDQITIKDIDKSSGYYILNNSFFITPISLTNSYATLAMLYTYKLADMTVVGDTSELPPAVEDYMMYFVERKIKYVDSAKTIVDSQMFTAEEREDMVGLFRNVSKDIKRPVISNSTYVNY